MHFFLSEVTSQTYPAPIMRDLREADMVRPDDSLRTTPAPQGKPAAEPARLSLRMGEGLDTRTW